MAFASAATGAPPTIERSGTPREHGTIVATNKHHHKGLFTPLDLRPRPETFQDTISDICPRYMGAHGSPRALAIPSSTMKLEEIQPHHCHALARRLLAEVRFIREELGRAEDTRPVPEITGAEPREVYFEALAAWRKTARVGEEVGVASQRPAPITPRLNEVKPGHVLQLLEGIAA